jgi:hypothetical protein
MAVEERRRIALHRAAAASWGEEVADTLVELVAPSGHELATRADIRGVLDAMAAMDERWDERVAALEARWDERVAALEARWDERIVALEARWDERFVALEARWDERLGAFERQLQIMDRAWQDRLAATEARTEASEHRVIAHHERSLQEAMTRQTRVIVVSLTTTVVAMSGLSLTLVAMLTG